jgi:hypothetical protein
MPTSNMATTVKLLMRGMKPATVSRPWADQRDLLPDGDAEVLGRDSR